MNPLQTMNPQSLMQNAVEQKMEEMRMANPQLFQKVQQMTNGKSADEMRQIAMNIAGERGIDLAKFAGQFGIKI